MSGLPVLLFLDMSGGEILLIMLVVFLVFGPEKMPEMARKAGRLMNQMKKASNDLTREFKKETEGLHNDISAIQNQVKDQVESVNREFNRTKSQVNAKMYTPVKPVEPAVPDEAAEENVSEKAPDAIAPKIENTTTKTE